MRFYDRSTGAFIADSSIDPLKDADASIGSLKEALSHYILSVSGWRSVFSTEGDEGRGEDVSAEDRIIAATAASAFFRYLGKERPRILLGSDARPTGRLLMEISARILIALGADLSFLGISSAPEIMAYSKARFDGFYYISASHNPIGHNGFKFGVDGGVLPGAETEKVKALFLGDMTEDLPERMRALSASVTEDVFDAVLSRHEAVKRRALSYYSRFVERTAHADSSFSIPFGVAIDFNGSARACSIDIPFLRRHGAGVWCCNAIPGQVDHAIVPEGHNLDTAKRLLKRAHDVDPSFILGYTPDNDGDRGNLVYIGRGRSAHDLSAQTVFALVAAIELAHAVMEGRRKVAIAANGPTSILIDEIAHRLGAEVFRADIGEANVVTLAEMLRKDGYYVPLCGEGSNGGCIIHPSKVRDPMNSVMTIAKLWAVPGLFGFLTKALCGRKRRETLASLLSAFPRYYMTPAFSPDAVMRIRSTDFDALKDEYERMLTNEVEANMPEGAVSYEVRQYEGSHEEIGLGRDHRPCPSTGGYRVIFKASDGSPVASLWLSRSRTEPVVRVMVDIKGGAGALHDRLLGWQRSMVERADRALS